MQQEKVVLGNPRPEKPALSEVEDQAQLCYRNRLHIRYTPDASQAQRDPVLTAAKVTIPATTEPASALH
jgi:hypothetical protein